MSRSGEPFVFSVDTAAAAVPGTHSSWDTLLPQGSHTVSSPIKVRRGSILPVLSTATCKAGSPVHHKQLSPYNKYARFPRWICVPLRPSWFPGQVCSHPNFIYVLFHTISLPLSNHKQVAPSVAADDLVSPFCDHT